MIVYGDYHTHTTYTHGKGTIEQNVQAAIKKGLKEIAITEHSFSNVAYGIKWKDVPKMKAEIEELRKKYPQIKILFGIESNLLDQNGTIDVPKDKYNEFDFIIMGYHKAYFPKSFRTLFDFCLPNTFYSFLLKTKRRIRVNTEAYIKAMRKNKIHVLAHLNYGGCHVDSIEVARVAKELGVFIELNGKRILFTDEEIKEMIKMKVKFIVNSDAHSPNRVGENHKAFALIERLNIPEELLVNVNKLPKFN